MVNIRPRGYSGSGAGQAIAEDTDPCVLELDDVTRVEPRWTSCRRAADEQLARPERFIRENMFEYRRVLDWMGTQREIDSESIGVFGVSLGGIDAVLLAALDERVGAAVVAMAGGDFSDVVMGSRDAGEGVSAFIERRTPLFEGH